MRINKDNYKDFDGKDVYACAFKTANSKKGFRYNHLVPQKMKLKMDDYYRWSELFYYGKKGQLLDKTRRMDVSEIFDNYEECVEFYNSMVQERLNEVQKQLNDLTGLLI